MGGEQSKIDATKAVAPATHCHFSMKILIKGDNNTGKTSLFNRLQRKRFIEEHHMTPQSASTTIEWEFPMSGFRVKIEVWDVVEAAKKKAQQAPLKLKAEPSNNQNSDFYNSDSVGNLDPETQRLIENTNAVIFMVNPSKKHTLDYVKRVVPQLPPELDVLIVINYKDQEDIKRAFSLNDVMILATDLGENVKYCEASMLNSFGIKAIKSFLNIPYVKAERIFLEEKLLQNENNMVSSEENFAQTFKEQDYKFYKEWFQKTLKERMDVQNKRTPSPTQVNKGVPLRTSTTAARAPSPDPKPAPKPAQAPPAKPPTVTSSAPENTGFFSKLKSMVSTTEAPKKSVNDNKDIEELKRMAKKAKEGQTEEINIDEFDPSSVTGEKDSYDSFFDDEDDKPKAKPQAKASAKPAAKAPPKIESDSEEEFNPLVTADKDDIDSDLDNEPSILSHFSISNEKPKVDYVPKPKKVKPPKPQPVPQNDNFSDEDIPQPANNKNNDYNNNNNIKPAFDSDDDDDFGGNALVAPDDDDIDDDFFDEPKQPPKPVVNQHKSDIKDKFDQKKNKNQKKNPVVSSNFDEDDDFAVDDEVDDSWLSDTPSDPKKKPVEKPAKPVQSKELDDFFDDDQDSGFDANSFYTPSSTSNSSDAYRSMGDEKKRERKHRSDRERGHRESRDRHKERGDRDRGDRRDREKRKPQEPSSTSTKPQATKNPYML